MDVIYECAANFQKLFNIKYHFVVSSKRKMKDITIDFREADFRHAACLHYVDDIEIEKDSNKVISAIINKTITDEVSKIAAPPAKIGSYFSLQLYARGLHHLLDILVLTLIQAFFNKKYYLDSVN